MHANDNELFRYHDYDHQIYLTVSENEVSKQRELRTFDSETLLEPPVNLSVLTTETLGEFLFALTKDTPFKILDTSDLPDTYEMEDRILVRGSNTVLAIPANADADELVAEADEMLFDALALHRHAVLRRDTLAKVSQARSDWGDYFKSHGLPYLDPAVIEALICDGVEPPA